MSKASAQVTNPDIKRVQSLTLAHYAKVTRRGHDTRTYIAEWNEDGKRYEFELNADYGRRVVTIKHLDSGDMTEVGFEMCTQWNPYPVGDVPEITKAKRAG